MRPWHTAGCALPGSHPPQKTQGWVALHCRQTYTTASQLPAHKTCNKQHTGTKEGMWKRHGECQATWQMRPLAGALAVPWAPHMVLNEPSALAAASDGF